MKKPERCKLWSKASVSLEDLNLESVNIFINSEYLKRDLLKCRECGQLYFHEWYEHMDFKKSASMYDTYIPVETDAEIEELLKTKTSEELSHFLPQLHGSHVDDESNCLKWIIGN